jgi:hypothetical protein
VNSPKGAALLEQCRQALHTEERPREKALNEQERLREPSQFPESRSRF